MANNKQVNGADHLRARPIELNADDQADNWYRRSYCIRIAARNRRLIGWSGAVALLLAFCFTEFVVHKKYMATAIIRPTASQDQNGLGGLLQSTGLLQNSNGLLGNMPTPPDPNELTAMLQSYAFTTSLVEREKLLPRLLAGSWNLRALLPFSSSDSPSPYSIFLMMNSRFDCDYSMLTGNMTLTFKDKNPELAREVLGLYINRLRDQVRAQTVRDTSAALASLEQEAKNAIDPLLRDQLYEIVGFQMQQLKTAEANADFAFTTIEPPFVSPYPCAPWVILDSVAAALLAMLMVYMGLLAREGLPHLRQRLTELDVDLGSRPDPTTISRELPKTIPSPQTDLPPGIRS